MRAAKTSRPVLASAIPRPRLFRRLDRASHSRLTWLCGPPGAGKSTLVSSYLDHRAVPSIWYQLDESDGDLATFFYYIGRAAPPRRRRRPLPLLIPDVRQHLSPFAGRFFRELFERFASSFVVVLDNYHELPPAAAFHDVLRCMIDELPANGRIIVLSRTETPSHLARHRLHQTIDIVAWDDLRFTLAEASRLIRASSPARWSRERIRSVYASTDGWCAGLVLLAQHEALGISTPAPAPSHSLDRLFDYFATEIFTNATPRMQDVMLQTAFLPWLTTSMAEKLTGRPDAGEVIQYLHRHNYFTSRKPAAEPLFEYHPLFRRFLVSQAQQSYGADDLLDIRRRAADVAEAADLVDAAVDLLRSTKAWSQLASLIARHAPQLLAQGRGETVERWLGDLPQSVMEHSPWLLYWRGMSRFAWRHAESQADLRRAFNLFRDDGDAAGAYLCWSAIIIAFEGEGNTQSLDSWFAEFERLRERFGEIPSGDVETRVAAAVLAAIVLRFPGHPDGPQWAARALELTSVSGDLGLRAITAFNWWLYHFQMGHRPDAAPVDDLRALIDRADTAPEVAVMSSVLPIWSEALTGDPAYRATTRRMLATARSSGMFNSARLGGLNGALMGALSDGDLSLATAWAAEYEKELSTLGSGYRSFYWKFLVRAALQQGDIAAAALHRADMITYSVAGGWVVDVAAGFLLSAQVLQRCGERQRAYGDLDQAKQLANDTDSSYVKFMVRLVEAELLLNDGDRPGGLEALRTAMSLGATGEFVNTPVWEPQSMSRLCAAALNAGIETDYVRRLIRRRQLTVHPADADSDAWPWPIKIRTLGRFDVLVDDTPITFPVKAQRRPVALLKALIATGASHVREERLVALLWPEASGDTGQFALATTLHRVRRLLGLPDAILRQEGRLSLNSQLCWVDSLTLQRLLEQSRAVSSESDESWQQLEALTRRMAQLYSGGFLTDEEDDAAWIATARQQLQTKLIEYVLRVGALAERRDSWLEATEAYEFGMKVDPCAETVCRRLMLCYSRLGRHSDTQRTFERFRDELRRSLDAHPSPETQSLWNQLRAAPTRPRSPA